MSNYAELTRLVSDLQAASDGEPIVEEALDTVADEIMLDQIAHVAVDTGQLRDTIRIISDGPGHRFIGPDHARAPHDIFVENDTKPHVIEAKPGKVLAFKVNGKTVFTKRVNHPGTKAQPFAEPSLTRWHESLGDHMSEVVVRKIIDGR